MLTDNKRIELLAPAGSLDTLKAVAAAGADAVYCGGKQYNMRMLRPHFNLDENELQAAADWLHERDKKLYVTVNNIYLPQDLNGLGAYIQFLTDIHTDAVIIQDLGMIRLIKHTAPTLPMHASVQMGINNAAAVKFLYDCGVARVILSKNLSLQEIESIHAQTPMELEYFVHGDMCFSHAGACYLSAFLSGSSSNRGICVKPCRWPYRLAKDAAATDEPEQYYLAHKDLCLYEEVTALERAGIISLKIEGRMRDAQYLTTLVRNYRQAMGGNVNAAMYKFKVRDLTRGSLYNKATLKDVGLSGENEPPFPTYTRRISNLPVIAAEQVGPLMFRPELSVKVASPAVLKELNLEGIDNLIIDTTRFRCYLAKPDLKWAWGELLAEINASSNVRIFLETPRIMTEHEFAAGFEETMDLAELAGITSFVLNDLGSLSLLAAEPEFNLWAGYGLNAANIESVLWLQEQGVKRIVLNLEMSLHDILRLAGGNLPELEVLVQGALPGMISDICIPAGAANPIKGETNCAHQCLQHDYYLIDSEQQRYQILTDYQCRNYLWAPLDLGAFDSMPFLAAVPISSFRIEGQRYSAEKLGTIIRIYKQGIQAMQVGNFADYQVNGRAWLLGCFPQGLTGGALLQDWS